MTISAALAAKLSPETRASLEESGGSFVIGGLAYTIPPPGTMMSSDDKLRNGIFSSAVRKAWTAAVAECTRALDSEAGPMASAAAARCALSHKRGISTLHGMVRSLEAKRAADAKAKEEERIAEGRKYHESWLARKNAASIRLPRASDFTEPPSAPKSHFASDGGGPSMMTTFKAGAVSFRKAPPAFKPALRSSVEIMEGMGSRTLTLAHAIGEGASRDLLSSRAYLVKKGALFLENFANPEDGAVTEESRAAFAKAQAESVTVRAAEDRARKREVAERVFAEWCQSKEASQLARECMDLMPCTLGFASGEGEGAAAAAAAADAAAAAVAEAAVETGTPHAGEGSRRDHAGKGAATAAAVLAPTRAATEDEKALWHAVGYACRCIHRILVEDWVRWSAPLFTSAQCWSAWNAFAPPAAGAGAGAVAGEAAESRNWGPEACAAALRMLHTLSAEHKRLALFRIASAGEVAPVLPMLRRCAEAEALPRFLHGSEGAISRVTSDLGIADGNGCSSLGGTGLGAELVLQWWVGEEPAVAQGGGARSGLRTPGAAAAAAAAPGQPESTDALIARLARASAASTAKQPPYVIVLESVGVSGGARSREGGWQRVVVDPPTPLPILTSAPGSCYTPVSPLAQGLCVLPPPAGQEWSEGPTTLRGAIRITGLQPNTCYAFRVRAYSRAGAGPYAFGAFTTAPAPPPAPVAALPTYVPRGILASEGAAAMVANAFPFQPDALTLIWDRGVDFRVGLLRLLRLFATAAARAGTWTPAAAEAAGATATATATTPRASPRATSAAPRMDADGIMDYGDDGGEEWGEGGGGGGGNGAPPQPAQSLFDDATCAPRTALLDAIKCEEGMRLWLCSCVAAVDFWLMREDAASGAGRPLYLVVAEAEMEGAGEGSTFRKVPARLRVAQARPVHVLEALVRDIRETLTWAEICALFSLDADGRSTSDLLLAGTSIPPPPPPMDATLPPPAAEALEVDPNTATAMAAITRSAGGGGEEGGSTGTPSRPGSARSASGSGRKDFNPVGGVFSEQSVKNSALRASQTKLTRTFLDKHAAAASGVGQGEVIAGGGAGAGAVGAGGAGSRSSSRPASASSATRPSRPASASSLTMMATRPSTALGGSGSGGGAPPSPLAARGGRVGSAPAPSPSGAPSTPGTPGGTAPGFGAEGGALRMTSHKPIAEVSQRYSLQQCQSDGPLGQEWKEVYLGVRAVRVVDKLLPGTTFSYKVQAINQDGVGSLMSPQAYITTALPCPPSVRAVGLVSATAVTIAWAPVSSANALSTARALSKPAGGAEGGEEEGADIDAILEALLAKTKGTGVGAAAPTAAEDKGSAMTLKSAAAAVPVREGDGGYGVDLARPWARYDAAGTGRIPVTALRGLLTDLGTYSETNALVLGGGDANEGVGSSGEGAAQVGSAEWRLGAAQAALDPKRTGHITFADFSDWWNAIDAALEKAASLNSAPGTPSRTPSRGSSAAASRPGTAGGVAGGAARGGSASTGNPRSVLGAGTGVAGEAEDLTAAVLYVLECRRSVPREEVAAAAAVVAEVARGSGASGAPSPYRPSSAASSFVHHPPTPRPSSARTTLSSPIATALTRATSANAAVEEAAALCFNSHTPWSVVYMGSTPRYRMTGLLPNGHYQFRVTALGRHAFSNPSKPLPVHLPPLAPFAPVAVRLGPRSCALRWYPGALGADKYEVQAKIVEALAPPGGMAGASTRRENDGTIFCGRNVDESALRAVLCAGEGLGVAAGGGAGTSTTATALARTGSAGAQRGPMWAEDCDIPGGLGKEREGGWAAVYTGMSTYASVGGLLANTVYRLRVIAFSSAGMPSRPSHETQLVTLDSMAHATLTPASCAKDFVLECHAVCPSGGAGGGGPLPSPRSAALPIQVRISGSGHGGMQDVVVGDTIVWTEDVWIDGARPLDPFHPAPPREVDATCPTRRFLTSRTIAAVVLSDSSSRLGAASGSSANVGGEAGPMPVGAMHAALTLVGKMPYSPRLMGKEAKSKEEGGRGEALLGTLEESLGKRMLGLQVEWCTRGFTGGSAAASKHLRPSHGADAYAAAHPQLYQKGMGCNIPRAAADLAALDIFRVPWVDEAGRWSLLEELGASFDN